jgi:SNF2 family DNA or RNA helicase
MRYAMQIDVINDKILSIKTDDPDSILSVIERSKQVAEDEVWVNFGLGETYILNNLKIPNVPSPIRTQYKWTGMYKPFEHQRVTAEFLTLNKKAFCLSEMGTGKTNSVIWAADYLMNLGVVRRMLVICPLSIMDAAWRRDLFRTTMHRSVEIAHGSREKRAAIISGSAEIVIINYDGVEIVEKEIDAGGFDLIVVDEATHLKNVATKRWKTLNKLIKDDTWLWLLTGTPAAQSPVDAYGLAKIMNPKSVPRAFNAFRDLVQIRQSMFVFKNRPEAEEIVHSILQPAIRYTKEECLDLPELVYQTRDVPLSAQQEKYYKLLKKEMLMMAGGEEISAANAAVALNKLLQLSAGAVYSDTGEIIEFDVKHRSNELLSIIDETPHKVIVFVMFRHTIELVQKVLQGEGHTVDIVHGGISVGKRAELFNQFQTSKDPRILVIQPQAAAHGVTLHAANTIIWWGMTLSLETYMQANARIHRAGQINRCTVVHLIGSPVEKRVLNVLESKGASQTKLLDLFKEAIQ